MLLAFHSICELIVRTATTIDFRLGAPPEIPESAAKRCDTPPNHGCLQHV